MTSNNENKITIPARLLQEINVKQQSGEIVVLVTDVTPGKASCIYVSPRIKEVTGYTPEEILELGLNVLIPANFKDRHDSYMLAEIRKTRESGPQVKIMGAQADQPRTVNFIKKDGSYGSMILPLYGKVEGDNVYVLGVLHIQELREVRIPKIIGDKLDVFISYGRKDDPGQKFHRELNRLLNSRGVKSWLDLQDIPLAQDFMNVIEDAIEKSSIVIFVAGPHSVTSPYCAKEIEIATNLGKEILVIFYKEQGILTLNRGSWSFIHPGSNFTEIEARRENVVNIKTDEILRYRYPRLAAENWMIWNHNIGFPYHVNMIFDLVNNDKDIREFHTKILLKALNWKRNGKNIPNLLNLEELKSAKKWLLKPKPNTLIPLIVEYISESSCIRSGGKSDVMIVHDKNSEENSQIRLRIELQKKGISVWDLYSSLNYESTNIEENEIKGLRRAANVIYLIDNVTSFRNTQVESQIYYAIDINKPVFIVVTSPVITEEWLPEKYKGLPIFDFTSDIKEAIYKIVNALVFHIDYKRAVASAITEAEEKWDKETKIALSDDQLASIKVFVNQGLKDKSYPNPPRKVLEMIAFSEKEKRSALVTSLPYVAPAVTITVIISLIVGFLRPIQVPEEISHVKEWPISVRQISRNTKIKPESIISCTLRLQEVLPTNSLNEPFDAIYAFVYQREDGINISDRIFVCQGLFDKTKAIPTYVSKVSINDPEYGLQLSAHAQFPSKCFAAFNTRMEPDYRDIAGELADELETNGIEVLRHTDRWSDRSILQSVLTRSEHGLIMSCPFPTLGSSKDRGLGGYITVAFEEHTLNSVNPSILEAIIKERAGIMISILALPPPDRLEKPSKYDYNVALFIKSKIIKNDPITVEDNVQQKWIDNIIYIAEKKNIGIDVYDLDCSICHSNQIVEMSNLFNNENNVDGIIFVGSHSQLSGYAVKDFFPPNVPVITFDTRIDIDTVASHIGPDNRLLAYRVATWGLDKIGNTGEVAIINGPLIQENAIERERGFIEAINENQNVTLTKKVMGDWGQESGYEAALKILSDHPNIEAIFVANDEMAKGANDALVSFNIRENVIITGFDYVKKEYILNDVVDVTISQSSSSQATLAISQMAELLINGIEPVDVLFSETVPVPSKKHASR